MLKRPAENQFRRTQVLEFHRAAQKSALITVKSANRLHDIPIKSPIAQRKLNSRLSIGDKAQIEDHRSRLGFLPVHDFLFNSIHSILL